MPCMFLPSNVVPPTAATVMYAVAAAVPSAMAHGTPSPTAVSAANTASNGFFGHFDMIDEAFLFLGFDRREAMRRGYGKGPEPKGNSLRLRPFPAGSVSWRGVP